MRFRWLRRSDSWSASMLVVAALAACGERSGNLPTDPSPPAFRRSGPAPTGLATIPIGSRSATIWPYLSADLSTADDPVNLVFTGSADPRVIRNALLRLDGHRGAPFPPVFPFDCTWTDAMGGLMAGFGQDGGWGGTAIQLQCGQYGPVRFHLRLVKLGAYTIGNAHFEVLIPGTTDHQVVSWEIAEQLVTYDLARTGLLAAPLASTGPINNAPTHRLIPPPIYNGLPPDLRALIGGPSSDVVDGVGIANDGRATVFALQGEPPPAGNADQHLVIQFDQIIPKPFCASGPSDYVLVRGPVSLDQEVRVLAGGEIRKVFRARGSLSVAGINAATGLPTGVTYSATVFEDQDSRATRAGGSVLGTQKQVLFPESTPGSGRLVIQSNIAPGSAPEFDRRVSCR